MEQYKDNTLRFPITELDLVAGFRASSPKKIEKANCKVIWKEQVPLDVVSLIFEILIVTFREKLKGNN